MSAEGAVKAGRREWIGLLVLALPCLLIAMDASVLDLAVVPISAELRPSSSELLWIVDAYGFVLAGSLITMGTLGDRIGRRRLLLIGAAAFGAASILAAFSTSAEMLIAARALLGVAGATLMPSTLSLIRNMFHDPAQRTRAIGVWLGSLSLGGAIGPLLGGVLLELAWWGSVFLLAVPVMILLLLLAPRLVPESRDPEAGRLDLPSAGLSLAAVLTLIYGLKQLAQGGTGIGPALAIVAGLAIGFAFVRRQRRLEDPLIDLSLFRLPAFNASLAANLLGFCVLFGVSLFTVQYMQSVLGMSALEAGVWMVPSFAAFIAGSMLTPMVASRVRPALTLSVGLAIAAAGFTLLAQVGGGSSLAIIVVGSTVFSIGLAPVFTLATTIAIGAAPPERAGAASGISETSTELGAALGIAILGSIGTAVYRGQLGDVASSGVSPHASAAARDTIGGAAAVSERLPGRLGAVLFNAAQEAFATGLQYVAFTSAVLTAAMAVLVVVSLRHVSADAGEEGVSEVNSAEIELLHFDKHLGHLGDHLDLGSHWISDLRDFIARSSIGEVGITLTPPPPRSKVDQGPGPRGLGPPGIDGGLTPLGRSAHGLENLGDLPGDLLVSAAVSLSNRWPAHRTERRMPRQPCLRRQRGEPGRGRSQRHQDRADQHLSVEPERRQLDGRCGG